MAVTEYNKLVRDNIPEIIRQNGETPITRVLGQEAYKRALLEKLVEEAKELLDDPSCDERADIAEVLKAIDETFGFSAGEVEQARVDKASKRGGFSRRIFLEKVNE